MEIQGKLKVTCADLYIYNIAAKLLSELIEIIYQICERYGEGEQDIRYYDVYLLKTSSGTKILKKNISQRGVKL